MIKGKNFSLDLHFSMLLFLKEENTDLWDGIFLTNSRCLISQYPGHN